MAYATVVESIFLTFQLYLQKSAYTIRTFLEPVMNHDTCGLRPSRVRNQNRDKQGFWPSSVACDHSS